MFRAKDIMTRSTVTVKRDTPIYDAVGLMVTHGVSGMPIVEDDMKLVGILSEKDVIKVIHEIQGAENKTVDDFMTVPAVHFDENESLFEVCDFLMKNIFRRAPVTSGGRLVGIISIRDALRFILDLRCKGVRTG